jgi:YVTN family beta-propeller protein
VGTGAVSIVPRPDGRLVWVTNSPADSITVVDTITHQVVDEFYHLRGPRWIEWLDPEHRP